MTVLGDKALKEQIKLNDIIRVSSNSVWLMSLWSYLYSKRDTRDEHMKEKPHVGTAIYKPGKETLEENSVNTFITNHLTFLVYEKSNVC